MMSQRDLFMIRPAPRRIMHPPVGSSELFPDKNVLLAAGRGTLGETELFGRIVLPSQRQRQYAVTGDVLRIKPREGHVGSLYAYLSTLLGLRLMRATAVGTKVLAMRADLLRDLPFPDISKSDASIIEKHLHRANLARDNAEECEQNAIAIIEREVMPQWLA